MTGGETFPIEFAVVGLIPGLALVVWFGTSYAARLAGIPANGLRRIRIASGSFLAVWFALASVLGLLGFFRPGPQTAFPTLALAIVLPILAGVAIVRRSAWLRRAVEALPQHWLIGVQLYRCVGALFLVLYAQGRMPGAFALPAGYGDILIGITAPLVAWLYVNSHPVSRSLAILWNVAGIADLVVAVTMGFLTSPGRWQLSISTPNELISAFPLVLVPTFAVPLSVLLHSASLWRLARKPGASEVGR